MEPEKIRRLYETDARGIRDEQLLDEVAFAFYARCESILTVTEVYREGRLNCPGCGEKMRADWHVDPIRCPACAWEVTWAAFRGSCAGQRLNGGGAVAVFRDYVERFPGARSPQEKMLLIDRLVHAIHNELAMQPQRPVAVNLIEGNVRTITQLLEGLAYGDGGTPGVGEGRADWERIRERQTRGK
jgi:hypothetical protein